MTVGPGGSSEVTPDSLSSRGHHNDSDPGVKTAAVLHAVSTTAAITLPTDTIYYALERLRVA